MDRLQREALHKERTELNSEHGVIDLLSSMGHWLPLGVSAVAKSLRHVDTVRGVR